MRSSKTLVILSLLIVLMALAASGVGLFWTAGQGSFSFTTLRGQTVEMYGRGLYAFDTAFRAPVLRGSDAIFLLVGIPMLILAIVLYRRGSLRGGLLLTGVLACFLYNSASVAFGAAYNPLFLLYVAYFSVSLFAFVLAFSSIDPDILAERMSVRVPRRVLIGFIFLAGLSPLVWLIDIIAALTQGQAPAVLASYTTDVTTVLDVGVIVPAAFLAGALLLKRKPLGYIMASTLLTLLTFIGLVVVGQTAMQLADGVALTTREMVTFAAPFVSLSVIAAVLVVVLLRNVSEPEAVRATA